MNVINRLDKNTESLCILLLRTYNKLAALYQNKYPFTPVAKVDVDEELIHEIFFDDKGYDLLTSMFEYKNQEMPYSFKENVYDFLNKFTLEDVELDIERELNYCSYLVYKLKKFVDDVMNEISLDS